MSTKSPLQAPILPYNQICGDISGNSFWYFAHMLSQACNQNGSKHRTLSLQSRKSTRKRSKMCAFCLECFSELQNDDTSKRVEHPSGIQGVEGNKDRCVMCAFYWRLILSRCDGVTPNSRHNFTVYVSIPVGREEQQHPIVDIGFKIKSEGNREGVDLQWLKVMAFCPDANERSMRAIWKPAWRVSLRERARPFRQWLQRCIDTHPQCSQIVLPGRPSRLLFIEKPTGHPAIRLVNVG
ncbi:hypothetical protein BDV96DRAFT_204713 [Lophiotrema nucula]|uniref:Uncharacterized protein n=1 Tax=Lophiotrema nucula TaxID=690887 RepID=A0A6A5ZQM1_9PLEO|nr:hypothetical protein BDV96DRAFT_204713 [Lophiotrema nucula]